MENTVVEANAPEVVSDDTQAVNAPVVGGDEPIEVNAADFLDDTPAEMVDESGDDNPLPKVESQKDFNAALSARLSQENTKGYNKGKSEVENSPEMQYIRAVIEDRAREKGITREQALRELNEERINARAQRYAKDPALFYKDQMLAQEQAQAQTEPKPGYLPVEEIAKQMADAVRSNTLPDGFDIHNPGVDFLQTASELGVKAALRIWKAEHASEVQAQANARQIAAEIERRRNAAKPSNPSSANPAASREVDFMKMSSEDFDKFDRQVRKAAKEGKTVRFR